MNLPEPSILSWSMKAPGIIEKADQESWIRNRTPLDRSTKVVAPGIPAALRRRCSALARLSVEAGLDCCRQAGEDPAKVATVLACRHGEIDTTVKILDAMSNGESVSPARFINSVHHTALGYYDLCTGNTQPSRAVSGGAGSFGYGFLECLALISIEPERPVLLIAGENLVPAPFYEESCGRDHPWAVALLLGMEDSGTRKLRLEFLPRETDKTSCEDDGLDFLTWWVEGTASLTLGRGRHRWRWERQ